MTTRRSVTASGRAHVDDVAARRALLAAVRGADHQPTGLVDVDRLADDLVPRARRPAPAGRGCCTAPGSARARPRRPATRRTPHPARPGAPRAAPPRSRGVPASSASEVASGTGSSSRVWSTLIPIPTTAPDWPRSFATRSTRIPPTLRPPTSTSLGHFRDDLDPRGASHGLRRGDTGQQRQPRPPLGRDARARAGRRRSATSPAASPTRGRVVRGPPSGARPRAPDPRSRRPGTARPHRRWSTAVSDDRLHPPALESTSSCALDWRQDPTTERGHA